MGNIEGVQVSGSTVQGQGRGPGRPGLLDDFLRFGWMTLEKRIGGRFALAARS